MDKIAKFLNIDISRIKIVGIVELRNKLTRRRDL